MTALTTAVESPAFVRPRTYDVVPLQGVDTFVPGCADHPEQFFSEDPRDLEHAKVLCRVCPLRDRCLAGALERREPWGVWGGEILDRGRIIAFKRGPGRPRTGADAVAG